MRTARQRRGDFFRPAGSGGRAALGVLWVEAVRVLTSHPRAVVETWSPNQGIRRAMCPAVTRVRLPTVLGRLPHGLHSIA